MRLLRRSRPRRAPQPVFISNSSGVTAYTLSDSYTDCSPANHSGPTDRVEIVIVRHERRPELEAGRGMHAILCAPCAEIGRASPDETVLDVDDFHRTEDGCGECRCGRGGERWRVPKVLLGEDFVADQPHPATDQADDQPERARRPRERIARGPEDGRGQQ